MKTKIKTNTKKIKMVGDPSGLPYSVKVHASEEVMIC